MAEAGTLRCVCVLAVLAVTGLGACAAGTTNGFQRHARFKGIGACLNQLIGPGPEAGSQRLYASHIYGGSTLDIVAVDPLTGKAEVFSSPIPGETGAWAMALGADGRVYIGTLPRAHLLRLDWSEHRLVDLGRPSHTEQYIWQLALGADRRLYGCTYPGAKLVRYDPAAGTGEDLGRMDEKELYARSVAADDSGFVYTGIGMARQHLAAYEIATGNHRDVLPPEYGGPGACSVSRGDDGRVYARAGNQHFRLDGWTATPIAAKDFRPPPPLRLADGRSVTYDGRSVNLRDPKTGEVVGRRVPYEGKGQDIFRLGLGPDGRIYGSTAMPIHFFRADPNGNAWEEIDNLGGGEFYSFLAHRDALVGAAYSGRAPLMIYRPAKPYAPAETPDGNPWLIHYPGENSGWRPMALVAGPGGKIYVGAVSGYGLLGGPLCVFDPETGRVDQYPHLVRDQSVISLASLPDGRIAGGTTVEGGGGSHPTQTEARLFLWDPEKRQMSFETVPVGGQRRIDALAVGRDGLVYGFAGPSLFVFDPAGQKVLSTAPHGLSPRDLQRRGPGT